MITIKISNIDGASVEYEATSERDAAMFLSSAEMAIGHPEGGWRGFMECVKQSYEQCPKDLRYPVKIVEPASNRN